MEINQIIDQLETWYDSDPKHHTSVLAFCTTRGDNDKDEAPAISAIVLGDKNHTMKALAASAYEYPEFEELLTRVMTIVSMLHKEDKAQHGKEAHHAS